MTYWQIQNRPQKRGKKPIKRAQYPKRLGATALLYTGDVPAYT